MSNKKIIINNNTLYFYIMKDIYYEDYGHLIEFQNDHNRGHGVMVIDINNLIIAVPLRSNLKPFLKNSRHIFPFTTYINKFGNEKLKALDFSKSTIIKPKYLNTETTYIFKDLEEKKFYLKNSSRIKLRLTNYINKYIKICEDLENCKKISKRTIEPYIYTTLVNFHKELDILLPSDKIIAELDKYKKK